MPEISQTTDLDIRIASLGRAYQRALRRKPTTLEKYHIGYAASMTARAEKAASDPSVSPEAISRIAGAAERARDDLRKVIEAAKRSRAKARQAPPAAERNASEILREAVDLARIGDTL
jgi:hypothetical protein